uniref:Acyl-CoA synthetase (AMP-forming)/AMP-acid ligase II n=1 Tax=Candidatus Kentrum sp. FW TaxID=2126338 RepID=A0A450TUY2_9GAMM|nr:MAG: Acyl-CoA synthetase (AMP-forming)/AMP-acid ligase II [Candidatus Kentron sp. FW]
MREETQHVITDMAYLERLDLDDKTRREWGRWFIGKQFEQFGGGVSLAMITTWRLLMELYPNAEVLSPFMDLFSNVEARKQGFLRLMDHEDSFRHTREASRFSTFEAELFDDRRHEDTNVVRNAAENARHRVHARAARKITTNNDDTIPWTTLVDLLCHRAQIQPDKTAYTFLKDGEVEEDSLTYAQLDSRARAIAARLSDMVAPGERVLLLFPAGLGFVTAFFGCLYAGMVAVPTYPPRRNRPDPRFQAIAKDARASVALTTGSILSDIDSRLTETSEFGNMRWLAMDDLDPGVASDWRMPAIQGDTLAFLQYTSGSTDSPKGVMVSHDNLMYNQEMLKRGFGHAEDTVHVVWLPLSHDMGLIGNLLQSLYLGTPCILLSPVAFLQQPLCWLQAISRYRATTSGGPNFAYDLCVDKIPPEQRAGLDLGSWTVAFNGAEPIRAETLERFTEAFAPHGFRRDALFPCYGLAETTVFVSGGPKTASPALRGTSRSYVAEDRMVTERAPTREFVGCGRADWMAQRIVVVDPVSFVPCPDGEEGEIWVSGAHVAQGYWNRPEETAQTFQARLADTGEGPFLRTGDLGFSKDGELFVTGRLKDMIIIHGQNYYPQDIEHTVANSHEALANNGGAAFSVERARKERLVIVREIQRTWLRRLDAEAVFEQYELPVDAIVLLKPGRLPKTSSGKVQRRACRERFLMGDPEAVGEWRQPETEEAALSEEGTIEEWLIDKMAQLTGIPREEINTLHTFAYYRLDSVGMVNLSGELGKWLGQSLSGTIAYEYPTIDALARHLAELQASDLFAADESTGDEMEKKGRGEAGEAPLFFVPDFS